MRQDDLTDALDMGNNKHNFGLAIGACRVVSLGLIFSMVSIGVAETSVAPTAIAPTADTPTIPTTQPLHLSTARLNPAIAAVVKDAVDHQTYQRSDVRGGAFGKRPFDDVSKDGVLIGFRIGLGAFFNNEVVKTIQPIYLTPRGEEKGKCLGNEQVVERTVIAKAPAGYAVGAISTRGGGGLDALTITYMKFNGTRLDPTEICGTRRIGGSGGGPSSLDGDGTPVIGITGRMDENGEGLGIGLIFVKPTAMVDHRER